MFGVFRVKNHDFTPKNPIFSNFKGGGGAPGAPPGSTPDLHTLSWFWNNQSLFLLLNAVCLAKKQQIPILFFGLIQMGLNALEPTIYRTECEHANHYTTVVVLNQLNM